MLGGSQGSFCGRGRRSSEILNDISLILILHFKSQKVNSKPCAAVFKHGKKFLGSAWAFGQCRDGIASFGHLYVRINYYVHVANINVHAKIGFYLQKCAITKLYKAILQYNLINSKFY